MENNIILRNCINCGAPLKRAVCEYCGTEYKSENAYVHISGSAELYAAITGRTITGRIIYVNGSACTGASDGRIHRHNLRG